MRAALAIVPAVVVAAGVSCSSPSDQELRFVDTMRNRYPDMSVSVIGDDDLIAAGESACSDGGSPQLVRLEALGVDRDVLLEAAVETICPTR